MNWTTSATVRLTAWIMAFCPFALALVVHSEVRPVPLSIKGPRLPALAFHQYAVDLRTIHPTTETQATFAFQNRSQEPVRITSMEPSCGCLMPRMEGARDQQFAAGGNGRIILRMQPANSTAGPHEYTVKIKYTDPEPQETTLTLKLVIPPTTLSVTPPALIVYHPAGSEPTVTDFTITDGRGTRFDVTDVTIDSEFAEAAIGETGRTVTGNFQQIIQVSIAGDLPPGQRQALLRIMTTDPDVPELRVPLLLRGPTPLSDEVDDDLAPDHETH